jgi:hypothetical protein
VKVPLHSPYLYLFLRTSLYYICFQILSYTFTFISAHLYFTISGIIYVYSLESFQVRVSCFFFFFFNVGLGFQLRASYLLGSTPWAIHPALVRVCVCVWWGFFFFWDRISRTIYPGLALNHDPPDLCLLTS